MPFGLTLTTITKIQNVFHAYPQIEQAILYGSRAKGNFKSGSDIDLSLTGDALELSIVNKLRNSLDDLLLPYTFDISVFSQIKDPELIEHIHRVGVVFYKR
jgi:uncharacterized protein